MENEKTTKIPGTEQEYLSKLAYQLDYLAYDLEHDPLWFNNPNCNKNIELLRDFVTKYHPQTHEQAPCKMMTDYKSGWINCKDKLPEVQVVVVFCENNSLKTVHIGWLEKWEDLKDSEKIWFADGAGEWFELSEVLGWHILPFNDL